MSNPIFIDPAMPETVISINCFFDEILHSLGHKYDSQARLSKAQSITIAAVTEECFSQNQQATLDFLNGHGYIPPLFYNPLQPMPPCLARSPLAVRTFDLAQVRLLDTFTVPVCHNIRIKHCKIY